MRKAGLLRQFSNSCLDLDALYEEDDVDVLDQLSPRSRGRKVVALCADSTEAVAMPPTPPGRGRSELVKTFSGSCLELDDMCGAGDELPSPVAANASPLYDEQRSQQGPARQIIEYVHQQNSRRRMLDRNRKQTVLVTGVAQPGVSFLATHIVAKLLHDGYEVRAAVRDANHGAQLRSDTKSSSGGKLEVFIGGDLLSGAAFDAALRGVDTVVHCPATSQLSREQVKTFFEKARDAHVRRVVLTSSAVCVHQDSVEGGVLSEEHWNDTTKEDDPAGWARVQAEKEAWAQAREVDIPLTVIVCSTVVGPSLGGEVTESLQVLCDLAGSPSYFPFAPRICRNLVDVKDVAAAHCAAITTHKATNQRYLLTGGNYTLAEIGHIIKDKYPELTPPTRSVWDCLSLAIIPTVNPNVTRKYLRTLLGYGKAYNTQKARQDLGIVIRHPDAAILEGVQDLILRGDIEKDGGSSLLPPCLVAAGVLGVTIASTMAVLKRLQ